MVFTIHFPSSRFAWTHPEPHNDALESFTLPVKPWKTRWRCRKCGCAVASYNSKLDKWSIWGAQLKRDDGGKIIGWDTIKPTAHIFYGTRVVDVDDKLGKWAGYEGHERIDVYQM